uniref:TSL-kinase interacting protein 1 n=1 Tax=Salix viminalis TaxID=40686 RepID=A0A6N2LX40_SALVM
MSSHRKGKNTFPPKKNNFGASKSLSLPSAFSIQSRKKWKLEFSFGIVGGLAEEAKELLKMPEKIKLQLFPIDEETLVGLEKDGYHPYLELTLSARKKVSSVLKHLNDKWGSSKIASGEPVLYPYNVAEGLASRKWTLSDIHITAGDVYAAIGNPSVFRLRYGWFSDSEIKSVGVSSTSTTYEACSQPQFVQKVSSISSESTCGEVKRVEETSEEFKPSTSTGAMNAVLANKMSSDGSIGPKGNETKMDVGIGQPSTLWDDGLTNISIGGLLSEASLQGLLNSCDPRSNGSNPGTQPSQLISDSFDAFITAEVNCFQGPRLSPHSSSSSILDAEDTCHAFSVKKLSASGKDCRTLSGNAYSQTCSRDTDSKSSMHPTTTEVNNQSGFRQDLGCKESETELDSRVRLLEKIIDGDSLSIGRMIT